jgi:tetratricopeptide (TPR) repeat protein
MVERAKPVEPIAQTPAAEATTAEKVPQKITNVSKVDVDAKTTSTNSVVDQLRSEYESCANGKDPVRCSQLALQLGRKYRQLGQAAEATTFLQTAVDNARTARLAQFEIDALGELGLLSQSQGNPVTAKRFYSQAVERATSAHLSGAKWQAELDRMPKD